MHSSVPLEVKSANKALTTDCAYERALVGVNTTNMGSKRGSAIETLGAESTLMHSRVTWNPHLIRCWISVGIGELEPSHGCEHIEYPCCFKSLIENYWYENLAGFHNPEGLVAAKRIRGGSQIDDGPRNPRRHPRYYHHGILMPIYAPVPPSKLFCALYLDSLWRLGPASSERPSCRLLAGLFHKEVAFFCPH